jgi:hypothetical protein
VQAAALQDWATRCGIDWNVPPEQQVDRPPAPPEDKRSQAGKAPLAARNGVETIH